MANEKRHISDAPFAFRDSPDSVHLVRSPRIRFSGRLRRAMGVSSRSPLGRDLLAHGSASVRNLNPACNKIWSLCDMRGRYTGAPGRRITAVEPHAAAAAVEMGLYLCDCTPFIAVRSVNRVSISRSSVHRSDSRDCFQFLFSL